MKPKITSFLASDTNSSLPHLFSMSNNFYSLDTFKPECSSTWDCSWLLTVCFFLWNLRMVYKSPYKYKVSYWSQIPFSWKLSFTVRNVRGLTWIPCLRLKQTKSENNSLSDLLWHIFYSPIFGNYVRLSYWCK